MNALIHTPLLRSQSVRTDFDNKILVIFLGIILILVVLGLVFIDLMSTYAPPPAASDEDDSGSYQFTIFT